ncbi:MAG TPA: zinc transporter ZupT [Candidatus Limnocylindrales bacterium]|nr:zinc transporter ZupT [Candidatus Limnocylindrales bacterium]
MLEGNILIALTLTLFAGLSTGVGGAIAFYTRQTNTRFLSLALGFSAGVMIYISFTEILDTASEALVHERGEMAGAWLTVIAFFGGMLIIALIDKLVPHFENPHEPRTVEQVHEAKPQVSLQVNRKLLRAGLLTAMAVGIHNFPEGFATFMASMRDPATGVSIAIAVAIHNIPEGIAISIPVYYATGNRKKAFLWSFLSGFAEPLGAVVGFLILTPFMSETIFGLVFAAVAGIMVFISFDHLLPAAHEYGEPHLSIYGLIAGMAVMAISLLLL